MRQSFSESTKCPGVCDSYLSAGKPSNLVNTMTQKCRAFLFVFPQAWRQRARQCNVTSSKNPRAASASSWRRQPIYPLIMGVSISGSKGESYFIADSTQARPRLLPLFLSTNTARCMHHTSTIHDIAGTSHLHVTQSQSNQCCNHSF